MTTRVRRRAPPFQSPLAASLERFLRFKRAMGFRYRDGELTLRVLDRFFASRLSRRDPIVTMEDVRAFIARRGDESDTTRAHRLSLIRQFCQFLAAEDPRTIVPPRHFLPIRRSTFVPRVLTIEEGRRFLEACAALPPGRCSPLRGVVHGTALTLLYLTGLRAGEALGLSIVDVDLESAILRIQQGKFGKSRLVPVAADVNEMLRHCRRAVEQHFGPRSSDAPFFPGPKKAPCRIDRLHDSFRRVLATARIQTTGCGRRPRIHDLRHSFAVHRLILWYRRNEDLSAKLPLLAVYLGHVGLIGTQRYLHLTQDVLEEITRRHQARFGHLITERKQP